MMKTGKKRSKNVFQIVEYTDGSFKWTKNGEPHRELGPAMMNEDGDLWYYKEGKLHNEHGPAIWKERSQTAHYYIDGKRMAEAVWKATYWESQEARAIAEYTKYAYGPMDVQKQALSKSDIGDGGVRLSDQDKVRKRVKEKVKTFFDGIQLHEVRGEETVLEQKTASTVERQEAETDEDYRKRLEDVQRFERELQDTYGSPYKDDYDVYG